MTIPTSIIIAVLSCFVALVAFMGLAIMRMFTESVSNKIDLNNKYTKRVEDKADSAHAKIKNHIKEFHLT